MPGRPKKFNDSLERSQREKLRGTSKESEATGGPSVESKEGMGTLPEVPLADTSLPESVQDIPDVRRVGGDAVKEHPMVHGRRLGPHVRTEASKREGNKEEVQGEVSSTEGEAVRLGKRGNDRKEKGPVRLRLVGWITRLISKRMLGKPGKKEESTMSNTTPPADNTEDTAPVKFIVSKNIRSIIIHTILPLVCVVIFNIIRIAKPELLWSEENDQAAIDHISLLVNQILLAVSAIMTVVGSLRDVNNFRKVKNEAAAAAPTEPPTK